MDSAPREHRAHVSLATSAATAEGRHAMRRALVIVSTLVVLALTAFAGSAAAAPSETPIGFVGACNMVASWPGLGPAQGVGVQPGRGMEHAMTVDNPNGNDGMSNAVFVSGNGVC